MSGLIASEVSLKKTAIYLWCYGLRLRSICDNYESWHHKEYKISLSDGKYRESFMLCDGEFPSCQESTLSNPGAQF